MDFGLHVSVCTTRVDLSSSTGVQIFAALLMGHGFILRLLETNSALLPFLSS